eukprot:5284398-Karenia_brevis.AAC.1
MMNIGTCCPTEAVLREEEETPTALQCLDTMMQCWISWGGYPTEIVADRGLNDRGIFAREFSASGAYCSKTSLEVLYQLGVTERHDDIRKHVASKEVEAKRAIELEEMARMTAGANL